MAHPFNAQGRSEALTKMASGIVDLLIIGGGITGAGLARDAALRGLSVALVEKEDFAYGTSSRSSKLVHGGLRYLANGQVNVVRESARERKVLKQIAPHLVHPLPFVFPIYKGDSAMKMRAGFFLFDKLANVTDQEKHQVLSEQEVRAYAPGLKEDLKSGFVYGEYMTEDARFTMENAASAVEHGALVANHAEVIELIEADGNITGAKVIDKYSKQTYVIQSHVTVNATGPWAQQLLENTGYQAPKKLLLSKGIHLVFRKDRLPIEAAVTLTSKSGKMGFLIPRWNYVYVGTTDRRHDGPIDQPQSDHTAIEELLQLVQESFPSLELTENDVVGTWAGVRPLIAEGKSERETSRHDEVWKIKPGLFTVAGGKLTTYRQMADRILNEVAKELERNIGNNERTMSVPLPGGVFEESYEIYKEKAAQALADHQLNALAINRIVWLYGNKVNTLLAYGEEDKTWFEPLAQNVPAIKGEVRLALEQEMVLSLADFIDRRSSLLLFSDEHGRTCAETVAAIMGEYLGWTDNETDYQIEQFLQLQT